MSAIQRSTLEVRVGAAGPRHILADAFEVRVREVVNGEYFVSFVYPRLPDDAERYAALTEDAEVKFPADAALLRLSGQRFVINRVEEIREGHRVYKRVEASHIAFNLGRYYYDGYTDFAAAQNLTDMLAQLSADTPFSFAISGTFAATDIFEYGEDTRFNLLQKLRQTYNAELSFDNEVITLTARKGGNYGARVMYRHNLRGITKTSHAMERITRLYGYGKNGLTIEGYGGHTVKYIDSAYIDGAHPYEGRVEFADIETPAKLLTEMQRHLAKYELPAVSYAVDFVDLAKVDPDFLAESIREAGDTVTVTDSELGYAFEARAIEYERYPFEPRRGSVVLANFRPLKASDYVFQAAVGVKKAISYTSRNAILKGIKYDDSITLVDGLGMRVSDPAGHELVRLGQYEAGKYGLAMFNLAGAKTIWQDATTGDAYFSGTVTAATITGGTITGATIVGSVIRTSNSYPRAEMSTSGNQFGAYNDASNFIVITPDIAGEPAVQHVRGGFLRGKMGIGAFGEYQMYSTGTLQLSAPLGMIDSAPGTYHRFPNWDTVLNKDSTRTLQQDLNTLSASISSVNSDVSGLISLYVGLSARVSALESA